MFSEFIEAIWFNEHHILLQKKLLQHYKNKLNFSNICWKFLIESRGRKSDHVKPRWEMEALMHGGAPSLASHLAPCIRRLGLFLVFFPPTLRPTSLSLVLAVAAAASSSHFTMFFL